MAASLSEQENLGLVGGLGAMPPRSLAGCGAAAAPSPPFRFATPRQLIDWRALHALDLAAVVRDTDIDALESVLDIVAHGDMEGEDPRCLTPANAARAFRVAQLAVDYLLHVQDRLATDACSTKTELGKVQHREQLLQLKVKELREELAGSRKEVRHLKKAAKTLETLALARQSAPPPPPEQRVVERVVEVPDAVSVRRAERLEAELAQLEAERLELQRDNRKLAGTLEAAQQGAMAAAENVRREEREAAQQRLQAAVEEERRRHSKAKLSVVVSGEESPTHQSKLAAALQRAETAEAELARAAAAAGKAAAAPAAEVRRLRAALEASQAEADMLRSRLAAAERGHSSPTQATSRQPGRGLGSELEDAADEARLQQLEAQVEQLRGQLACVEAARAQLAGRCAQLEQQVSSRQQHAGPALPTAAAQREATEAQAARLEAARLREEKAALKEECRRLRQEAAGQAAEIEHLTQRLQQLAGTRGSTSSRAKPAPLQAAPGVGPAERRGAGAAVPHAASPPEGRGVGSPILESAARSAGAAAGGRAGSPGGAAQQQASHAAGSPAAPPATRRVAASPSKGDKAAFRQEMQHTLHTAERPGVVSRFPHSLGSFLALRGDLQGELDAELAEELASYGIDPGAQGLTDDQLAAAMAELERRRADARRNMSEADQQRADYMRSTVNWHVQRMAELACGQRVASPVKQAMLAQPPISLKPIRTYSGDATVSLIPGRSPKGFVHEVLEHVGDEAAVYSPLARGASVLSDRGYLEGSGLGSPHSSSSPAQLLLPGDGACTPRSAASNPSRQSRAVRSVQFGSSPPVAQQMRWGGDEEAVAVQRVGRRPSFTQQQAVAAAAQLAGSPGAVPGVRRVLREAESIAARAGPWDEAVQELRDRGTGEAAPVRPAIHRLLQG